ncbi:MAG: hypothetical protein QOG03_1549 [Actinomycetota bacterium]|jgi:hypothetical protein|nr:hypothetical protein [Actinomycetota bacterium]
MLTDLLTAVVFLYVGASLVRGLRRSASSDARRRMLEIVRGLRVAHFVLAPVVLLGVAVAIGLLWLIPPLRWGWWTALGGNGNIIFGSTSATQNTVLEWLVPAVFIVLLVPALPLLVEREEIGFRLGAEGWSNGRRFLRGLQFGLLHLIAGIPIAAALALAVGGWAFTAYYLRWYRKGGSPNRGVLESTRLHLAYDIEVVGLVAVLFLTGWA